MANFEAGRMLTDAGQHRSAVSRFYYAAFSVLTDALASRFTAETGQETPNHKGLRKLIKNELTSLTENQRREVATLISRLYDARIDADYRRRTVDEQPARRARRDVAALFEYLEVEYGR